MSLSSFYRICDAVERKKRQTVAPFHAADITRASLRGNVGGAV